MYGIFCKRFFPRNGFLLKCFIQKFKHLNSKCLWYFFFVFQLNKMEPYRKHIQARHSCVRSKIRWAWDQMNKMRMLTKMHYNTGILFPKLFWHTVTKKCSCDQEKPLNSRLKANNLQIFWDYYKEYIEQFIRTVTGELAVINFGQNGSYSVESPLKVYKKLLKVKKENNFFAEILLNKIVCIVFSLFCDSSFPTWQNSAMWIYRDKVLTKLFKFCLKSTKNCCK